jgi:hypothetical protein
VLQGIICDNSSSPATEAFIVVSRLVMNVPVTGGSSDEVRWPIHWLSRGAGGVEVRLV